MSGNGQDTLSCPVRTLELLDYMTFADQFVVRLYQAPHCSYIYGQSFFSGVNFYGNFFYGMSVFVKSILPIADLL